MKNNILFIFLYFLSFTCVLSAQEQKVSVKKRIIFIGNAGEKSKIQSAIISDAAQQIIPNQSITVYLGNNIYPDGMSLKESDRKEKHKAILESQYQPMRDHDAEVFSFLVNAIGIMLVSKVLKNSKNNRLSLQRKMIHF